MAKRKKRTTKKRTGASRRRVSQDTKMDLMKAAKLLGAGAAGLLVANKAADLLGKQFGSMAKYAKIAIPAGMAIGIPILMRKMGMRDNVLNNALIAGAGITAASGLADLLNMQNIKQHLGLAGEDDIVEIDLNDPAQLAAFSEAVNEQPAASGIVSGEDESVYLPEQENPAMGYMPPIVA